jgi:hypothetical protein
VSVAAPSAAPTRSAAPTPTPSAQVAAPCKERALAFDPGKTDLTGAWLGDDAGIYYLRQVGKQVYWNGMSGQGGSPGQLGREWNNVAHGELADDVTVELHWADVPRGGILGAGTLTWKVEERDGSTRLRKTADTGSGFGARLLTPCGPG